MLLAMLINASNDDCYISVNTGEIHKFIFDKNNNISSHKVERKFSGNNNIKNLPNWVKDGIQVESGYKNIYENYEYYCIYNNSGYQVISLGRALANNDGERVKFILDKTISSLSYTNSNKENCYYSSSSSSSQPGYSHTDDQT